MKATAREYTAPARYDAALAARRQRKAAATLEAWSAGNVDLGMAMIEAAATAREELLFLQGPGRDGLRVSEARIVDHALSGSGPVHTALQGVVPAIGMRLLKREGVVPLVKQHSAGRLIADICALEDRDFRTVCAGSILRADLPTLASIAREHLVGLQEEDGSIQLTVLEILSPNLIAGCLVEIALSRTAPPEENSEDAFATIISEVRRERGLSGDPGRWQPDMLPRFEEQNPYIECSM